MNATTEARAHPDDRTTKTITVIGFGRRLAAILLDALLLGVLSMFVAFLIGMVGVFVDMYTPNRPLPLSNLIVICTLVFSVAYYVVAWSRTGQTVGKTMLGIKIVGADGKPLSGGKAFLRYIGYLVSGIVFALGFIWVLFDRKRQGWHDKMAGTYVVDADAVFTKADAVTWEPSDPKPSMFWIVIWILLAIGLPVGAVTSILTMGPFVGKTVTEFFTNLR